MGLMNKILGPKDKSPTPREDLLPPLPPIVLKGYKSNIKRKLMTEELSNNLRNLLPNRLQLFDEWQLIYSMDQDGISLNTLYNRCDLSHQLNEIKRQKQFEKGYGDQIVSNIIMTNGYHRDYKRPIGFIMVIRDSKNNRFGCYLNENLRPMDHKRYYGNGECFLWKLEKLEGQDHQRFKAFMYTGINDNIIYSNHDFIAIGSSKGQNGLWINSDLLEGVSFRCETFGNEVLNGSGDLGDNHELMGEHKVGKFKILGLEIWRIGTLE